MRKISDEPQLTRTYEQAEDFCPNSNSLYIYGRSPEIRSGHIEKWSKNAKATTFVEISDETLNSFKDNMGLTYFLRSQSEIANLWKAHPEISQVYLDITGLTHSVWATILRAALSIRVNLSVIYVEPNKYSRSSAPLEGQIYDLSKRIQGISPLPGFAVLSENSQSESLFVPLLGFEGTRFRHLIEQVQPAANRIYPVIGSPGFKPWYIYETYLGNKSALLETEAWKQVMYASANCPFSCYYILQDLALANQNACLKIAPIGTKPHALGAVLFALSTGANVELIYDHPIRTSDRSTGKDRLYEYYLTGFVRPRDVIDKTSTVVQRSRLSQ